jgi:hypothetical protein
LTDELNPAIFFRQLSVKKVLYRDIFLFVPLLFKCINCIKRVLYRTIGDI